MEMPSFGVSSLTRFPEKAIAQLKYCDIELQDAIATLTEEWVDEVT